MDDLVEEFLFDSPLEELPSDERLPTSADHWQREHFIPLRKAALVQVLAESADLSREQKPQFLQLCRLLDATFHHEFHYKLERLKSLYARLNPDSVMIEPHPAPEECAGEEFFQEMRQLLIRANYQELSQDEIQSVVGAASDWGVRLHVDFAIFRHLAVFVRGDVTVRRKRRNWRKWYREEDVDVPIYQRLVVFFHLDHCDRVDEGVDTDCVYLKIFKNIPKLDIDMLLPGARFKMSMLDQGKILLPTISGLVMAGWKIIKGAVTILAGGIAGILFVAGTIGYGVKSFLGYQRTKDKYQLSLTRSLYYQNLDNNAGVFYRILDEAEEQEFREAILAYALLRRQSGPEGWTMDELDAAAEQFLKEHLGFSIDFEVHDALGKLERLGCAASDSTGRWRAIDLPAALHRLDETWDAIFSSPIAPRS